MIDLLTGLGKLSNKNVKVVAKTRGTTPFNKFVEVCLTKGIDVKTHSFKAMTYDLSSKVYKIHLSERESDYYLFNESDLRSAISNNFYEES